MIFTMHPRGRIKQSSSADLLRLDTVDAHQRKRFSEGVAKLADPAGLRNFPWRHESDRYRLLIAEIFLRRTNAASADKVYAEFTYRFPDLDTFRTAEPTAIYEVAVRAGLNWRADNLVTLSKQLAHERVLPGTVEKLESLPGVGPYVARAVALNADEHRCVPVDANVVRIISRFFGLSGSDNLRRNKKFQKFADALLPAENPRTFNYAMLDHCATVCIAARPRCSICSLNADCMYPKKQT